MEGGKKQPDPVAGSSSAKDAPSKQVKSSTLKQLKASVEMNNVSRLHRKCQLCLGTFLLKYRFPHFILTHLHAIIRTHGEI